MRLLTTYETPGPIPLDYRKGFMSLIKESLKDSSSEEFKRVYGKRAGRNIVFNCCFGKDMRIDKKRENIVLNSPTFLFELSSPDTKLIAMIYNGLRKNREYAIFDSKIKLKDITPVNTLIRSKDRIRVRSVCPILVKSSPDSGSRYLLPGEESFYGCLNHFCKVRYEEFFSEEFKGSVELLPLELKRVVVKHMGTYHTGFKGIFELSSSSKMLQFLYDAGIGTRTSQGFGMLELVS
ncbi:CRISPR-associated endoribonuclease Cas6 [Mesotoga sp. UBA5847]|uniref:CRISPR-associated endoribonuclease Cas6 n=1 Tax=Mesotoga sp. UBA5847 TaxID=1946859 RepID=UPI0025E84CE0|nr:CRISPR-associated endoribonuclease Cas6 [Mesotoga sp. UBA5847]